MIKWGLRSGMRFSRSVNDDTPNPQRPQPLSGNAGSCQQVQSARDASESGREWGWPKRRIVRYNKGTRYLEWIHVLQAPRASFYRGNSHSTIGSAWPKDAGVHGAIVEGERTPSPRKVFRGSDCDSFRGTLPASGWDRGVRSWAVGCPGRMCVS